MTNTQQAFLKELEKVNLAFQEEVKFSLLQIYHLLMCDNLTVNDLEEIANRYNIDLTEEYYHYMDSVEDNEEDI